MNELLNRLLSTWDTLSPRERILVGIAGGGVILGLLIFGVVMPILRSSGDDPALANVEQQVETMRRLRSQYDEVNSRLSVVESRIARAPAQGMLKSLLASLARDSSVEVESMDERPAADSELYKETKVEIKLARVTLEQVIRYLHSIESNQRPLSIKSLRIKKRPDKSRLLDVNFSVSSFSPL